MGVLRKLGLGCLVVVGAVVGLVIIVAVVIAVTGQKSAVEKPQTGHIGQVVHVPDNLDVTLLGVTRSPGDLIEKPKTGNEFLITHWRFHNNRSSTTDVADTGFTITSQGVILHAEFASSLTANELGMNGTTLAVGGTVQRDIVFQATKGAPASILYQPDPSDSKKAVTWTVRG